MRSLPRRLLGVGLLGLVYLPLHRLLAPATTGAAGEVTRRVAEGSWWLGLWGTLATAGVAVLLAVLVRGDPLMAAPPLARALERPSRLGFAAACGLLGFLSAAGAALFVFGHLPTSVDEMVQLLHARALLSGSAALPLPADPAAWTTQNAILVARGWASIYPPTHTLLLAAGLAAGAPWLVGPLATGVMAGASAWSFEGILVRNPAAARVGGLLVALSPFVVFLGGTELSHASAGAFVALALAWGLKAADGSWLWALAAGAATGAAVSARPWTGMALCAALLAAVWIPARARASRPLAWVASRGAALALGGLPFAVLLLGWNAHLFGDPFRLGYVAAFGPAHGLGFHVDPWGNAYGVREALAYTGADVVQLGARLFESPLPALALVGVALVLAGTLPAGSAVLLAWGGAGVLTAVAYWHHGIHFGPRLWFEAAPAWIGLWAVAVATLAPGGARGASRVAHRAFSWAALLTLLGGAALLPGTVAAYRADDAPRVVARIPAPPAGPSLLFVHGSWGSRVAARLAAGGMRRDSIETALRRNALCAVDGYAHWLASGVGAPPALDFTPEPGRPSRLRTTELSPGNRVLVDGAHPLSPTCARQAAADRLGTVELEPLLWQAPPLPGAPLVVARDLGPDRNAEVQAAFPGYRSWAVVDGGADGPRLMDYAEAMDTLWGATAPVASGSGR